MTPQQARVIQAEANASAARTRLTGSVAALQERVRPATLVREARRELAEARRSAGRVVDGETRRLALGGGLVSLVLLGVPLLRWRGRRHVAKRAARIRGD